MASLRDAGERERRLSRRNEPHVEPLNRLADRIAAETGLHIPLFDPDSAGVYARGLVLAQDPSPTALDTGFVSPNNPDATATATTRFTTVLDRRLITFWNSVPWYCGGRTPKADDEKAGASWLAELLPLLPELRAVLLTGSVARNVWSRTASTLTREVQRFESPHLSARGLLPRRGEPPDARTRRAERAFTEFGAALRR